VLETEVDSKLFYSYKPEELRAYFDAHKDKFIKPETVELSEIFLSLAGKPEADVKARAAQLVTQLRGGANFAALAKANSERSGENGGKLDCLKFRICGQTLPQRSKTSRLGA